MLEKRFGRDCLPNIAVSLCIGGNDFLPKFHGFSHEKWLLQIIQTPGALHSIVNYIFDKETGKPAKGFISNEVYFDIVKKMYCPLNVNADDVNVTLATVRQMTIKLPNKDFKQPTAWMPPQSALFKVIQLINCQIAYLLTVSKPDAPLPNFMSYDCLRKDIKGNVLYDFGEDVKVQNLQSLLTYTEDDLKAIIHNAAKSRKKRPRSTATTPVKPRREKRRPLMSTPMYVCLFCHKKLCITTCC